MYFVFFVCFIKKATGFAELGHQVTDSFNHRVLPTSTTHYPLSYEIKLDQSPVGWTWRIYDHQVFGRDRLSHHSGGADAREGNIVACTSNNISYDYILKSSLNLHG